MNCEQRHKLMLPYLADCLEAVECAELRAHLASGCRRCSESLAEAQATLDQLTMSIDPITPPPSARRRLLRRLDEVAASHKRTAHAHPLPTLAKPSKDSDHDATTTALPVRWHHYLLPPGLAAAIAVLATWTIMSSHRPSPEQPEMNALAALEAKIDSLEEISSARAAKTQQLSERIAELHGVESLLRSPSLRVVSLAGGELNPDAWARLMFDPQQRLGHVVAGRLEPAAQGRAFSFWFGLEDQTRVPVGPVNVDESGNAAFWVEMPPESEDIISAGISDDPIGEQAADEPSHLRLFGKLQTTE